MFRVVPKRIDRSKQRLDSRGKETTHWAAGGRVWSPATRALFGAGISVCPDLPAVDILNLIGNESVPKIIINDTIDLFLTVISIRAHFRSLFARGLERCGLWLQYCGDSLKYSATTHTAGERGERRGRR